ncbi:hypothetical protein BH20ACT23_BH20ACT23_13640 [soil metagenome]
MRIVIETDEGKGPSVKAEPSSAEEAAAAAAPPPEVAARAAAEGALSAGPAPDLPRDEGPIAFLPEPGTPATAQQTAPGAPEDASAGAAPDFALGDLAVDQEDAEEEDAEEEGAEE